MLNNKINYTQMAKKLTRRNARSMYFIDGNSAYLSDGIFVFKTTKSEFDTLVSGYDLDLATFQNAEAVKTVYNNIEKEFENVTDERTFLHFHYKDEEKTMSFANLNGEVIAVNKTYIELVGPEKRNGKVVFNATKVKAPIRLLDNLFVMPISASKDVFDELKFIFGQPAKETINEPLKEAPMNNAKPEAPKQEVPKTKAEQQVNDTLFEIKDGTRTGFYEFYFKEKPSPEVLLLLKGFKMHWNRNKVCWFGYVNKDEVAEAITKAVA